MICIKPHAGVATIQFLTLFGMISGLQNFSIDELIPKQFVKLSLKQGLIMNQVLGIYALENPQNSLCKNHTNEFKNALRAFESWALKMFDASSKLQSGILLGNLVDLGSFKECISINHDEIQGKYCLLTITPSLGLIRRMLKLLDISEKRFEKVRVIVEKSTIRWGVCVPNSCSSENVFTHFNKNIIETVKGLDLKVSLNPEDCATINEASFKSEQYFALIFLGSFVLMALISLVLPKSCNNPIIEAFSLTSNCRRIFAKGQSTYIDCVHGLRFLSTTYVVIGHRYLMLMFFPITNSLEILDWILNYSSTIIIGGTVCVDTFFMISGMLGSLSFFNYVTKSASFNLMAFYLRRYLRVTPALAIVVLVYTTLIQFFGSGPLWLQTYKQYQDPCRYYWWSTILHVQNYVNPGNLVWYLSCDMLYFYVAPLILYPIWKKPCLGYLIYVITYVAAITTSFYIAWINKFEGVMPVTNQLMETPYFQNFYIAPHTRAAPYIIGLGLGIAIINLNGRRVVMSFWVNLTGWILALGLITFAIFGCHIFLEESHDYNRLEASIFLSCSRSAWTMGVIWIVWSCINGHGGFANDFLSSHVFRVLGRISYSIFLLHIIFQFLKSGASKTPTYFSNFDSIYNSLGDLIVMIAIGFLFTIIYELPLSRLVYLLISGNTGKVTQVILKN